MVNNVNIIKSDNYAQVLLQQAASRKGAKSVERKNAAKTLTQDEIKKLIKKEIPGLDSENAMELLGSSQSLELLNRKVHLRVNKDINRVIITIVDKESNQVVKEIPCEELQNLAAHLKKAIGVLHDEEA
ncbi:MAG TPA: flagellar protein FlaG [Spirochaetota bacterium]|mgnify:FL=1|nr:flagellar protein FlaG [Spirochaetota bacterium]